MRRKKIVIVSPFPIYPIVSAGASRIYQLEKLLSHDFDVIHFSQGVNRNLMTSYLLKGRSYKRIKVGKHYEIIQSYNFIHNISLFLISRIKAPWFFAGQLLKIIPIKQLSNMIKDADVIQVEHPWQFDAINEIAKRKGIPVVLSIHNIEEDTAKFNILDNPTKNIFVNLIKNVEEKAYKKAENIVFISAQEKEYFLGIDQLKRYLLIPMCPNEDLFKIKRNRKRSIYTTLFSGSSWPPNVEALKIIEQLAKKNSCNKQLEFLIVGGVGEGKKNTPNIRYTGKVDSVISYFSKADIFINPITSGSGISLKIIEALAAGLPVITTRFGARGYNLEDEKHVLFSEINSFNTCLNKLINDDELIHQLAKNGKSYAKKNYYMPKFSNKIQSFYWKVLNKK